MCGKPACSAISRSPVSPIPCQSRRCPAHRARRAAAAAAPRRSPAPTPRRSWPSTATARWKSRRSPSGAWWVAPPQCPLSQHGFKFADTELKERARPGVLANVPVSYKKNRIIQFRQRAKQVDEICVLGGIDRRQGSETGARLHRQVDAGYIGTARSDVCLRNMRPHPTNGGQVLELVDRLQSPILCRDTSDGQI